MAAAAPSASASWAGRKVLVTGGAGFLGSNLVHALSGAGADVIAVDNFIAEGGANRANLEGVAVRLIEADIANTRTMMPLLADCSVVFNLAGRTGHLDSMTDPMGDLGANAAAQLAFLEACRAANPQLRIVFTSTRQVYGRPQRLPVDESHPLEPPDINAVHKIAAEQYHLLYHRVHGLKSVALRLTNCFGPAMRVKDARQTFVGVWIRRALEGGTVEVWGGEQRRDLLFAPECAAAMMAAADCEAAMGRVFNIAGSTPLPLSELAQIVVAAAGGGKIERREFPAERKAIDIGDFLLDDRPFRTVTGWAPAVPLKDALERTIAYYRDRLPKYL
ncbi:MAG: NAD-dependent epimerase/dehydratase family protein [Gemmatimonas sp.]